MKNAWIIAVTLLNTILPPVAARALTPAEATAVLSSEIAVFQKTFKRDITNETKNLKVDLDGLVENVRNGSKSPAEAASDLRFILRDRIFEPHRLQVNVDASNLTFQLFANLSDLGQNTLPGFLPGDGGRFDKMQAGTEAALVKARQKVAGLVKKFVKGFREATGGTHALTVVLPPLPIGRPPVATQTGVTSQQFPATVLVVVAVRDFAAGTGDVHIGGSGEDGTLRITATGPTIRSATASIPTFTKLWATSFDAVDAGFYEIDVREDGAASPAAVQAIGVP